MGTLKPSYDGVILFTLPVREDKDFVYVTVLGDGDPFQFSRPVKLEFLDSLAKSQGYKDYEVKSLFQQSQTKSAVKSLTYVYFIQAVDGGLIKIGKSEDPINRLATIQMYSPVKLQILAATPHLKEKAMHKAFADERVHGEWFKPSDRLLALISEVAASEGAWS